MYDVCAFICTHMVMTGSACVSVRVYISMCGKEMSHRGKNVTNSNFNCQ